MAKKRAGARSSDRIPAHAHVVEWLVHELTREPGMQELDAAGSQGQAVALLGAPRMQRNLPLLADDFCKILKYAGTDRAGR